MHNLSYTLHNKLDEQFHLIPEEEIFLEKGTQRTDSTPSNIYSLLLILSGRISIHMEGLCLNDSDPEEASLELSKESGILLPFDIPYSITSFDDSSIRRITLSGSLTETILSETLCKGNYVDSSVFFQIIRDLNYLKTFSPDQSEFATHSFSLLLHLYQNTKPLFEPVYPPLIIAAMRLMEENFTYLYGIEELAEQLEVSKNHLIRQFHNIVGISPGRYLTNVKIHHAKELLQNSETPLELIAVSCGFSGASYFRKVFKKETGLSPTEFRRKDNFISSGDLPNEFYL